MSSLTQRFLDVAARRADKTAVVDPTTSLTYGALAASARAAAGAVAAATARPFVGIAMPSCAAFPAAYFCVLLAGKTPVPLNFLQEPATLAAIVADASLDTVLTVAALAEPLRKLVPAVICCENIRPDAPPALAAPADAAVPADCDVATLLYTSGTAGAPKGVMLTHRNLLANVDSSVLTADYTEDDVSLGLLPLFHAFGITCTMLLPLLNGAKAVFLPRFSPAAALAQMQDGGVTCIFAVPSIYRLLVQAAAAQTDGPDVRRLRFCVSGGEALGREVAEGFARAFGRPLMEGYGLTEASPVVSLNPPDAVRAGTVGRPLSWAEVRIAAPDGRPLPAGSEGELLLRGDCVMKGYLNRPDETLRAIDADGWLHTGDMARVDAAGYLSITGRIKEMIISAGENIAPGEIETVLNGHPAVLESAVVGRPDASRGEVPHACVVLRPGARASEAELIDYCRSRLARLKVPRGVEFRPELPHTLTGKILKRAIR